MGPGGVSLGPLNLFFCAINEINARTPTSDGADGQVWTSDGAGAGKWADASGGGRSLYTGTLKDFISNYLAVSRKYTNGAWTTTVTIKGDFEIEYFSPSGATVATVHRGTFILNGDYPLRVGIASDLNTSVTSHQYLTYTKIAYGNLAPSMTVIIADASENTASFINTDSVTPSANGGHVYRIWV